MSALDFTLELSALAVAAVLWLPGCIIHIVKKIHTRLTRRTLKDKVVLVTGASSGIGRALCFELYAAGCRLILASRSEDALTKLRDELVKSKNNPEIQVPAVLPLDLGEVSSLASKGEEALSLFGRVDVLVNNGGISQRSSVLDTDVDTVRRILNVNYLGAAALAKSLLPSMISQGSGHIVNVSSVQGLVALPERSAYSASKHALQAFSDALRAEVADSGVGVSVVSIGYVNTNLSVNALKGSGEKHGVLDADTASGYSPDYVASEIREAILLRKNELMLMPFLPRLLIAIRKQLPWLYFKAMEMRARKTKSKSS